MSKKVVRLLSFLSSITLSIPLSVVNVSADESGQFIISKDSVASEAAAELNGEVSFNDVNPKEYTYQLSESYAYRIPDVNQGEAIKANGEYNSIRIIPKLGVDRDSYIYIKINNGYFDEEILSECKFGTAKTKITYDMMYDDGRHLRDILIEYIGNEASRALPYKLEYVNSTTLKATLFPIGDEYAGINNDDVTIGIPLYDIMLPAVAGSEKNKVTIDIDGNNTTIESCNDIYYANNNGYVLPDSEYFKIDTQYAEREISVEPNQPITYDGECNSIIIKPMDGVEKGDSVLLKIKNGHFAESMLGECEFRTYMTNTTYDEICNDARPPHIVLKEYIWAEGSRELPYKLEYVDDKTLKVHLFPIDDIYVNQNDDSVTHGIPIYKIALPAVAGEDAGYTQIAVNNNGSSIKNAGWYTIARINSEADYESEFTVTNQVKVNSGSNVLYEDKPIALKIKPSIGIGKDESILINIKNGYFDEALFNSCEFKTNYTALTYDMLLEQLNAGRPLNDILHQYIGFEDSSQLPYKLEYVDRDTIKVLLFPINDADVGAADTVTKTNPIYSILLPAVAGEYNGDITIAVDGNGSSIQTAGWYKIADVIGGLESIVTIPVINGNLYLDALTNTITGADSTITAADIPEAVSGINITGIDAKAFSSCSSLTEVVIPSSITNIGSGAFMNVASGCKIYNNSSVDLIENADYRAGETTVISGGDIVYGDVNGDGKVTTADALVVARLAIGKIQNDELYSMCDYNKDGKITTADALVLARYAIGKISSL
ncbi:MAG: dockerin type I domain-containing protein [Clostridia bacterium]|nr:dockerin type I domain-containing protein [Clostridia bacterium]